MFVQQFVQAHIKGNTTKAPRHWPLLGESTGDQWPFRLGFDQANHCLLRLPGDHDYTLHDNVIKWKHFPRYWPFVRGTHRSPVNSPHKGQWHGALIFFLICTWTNDWANNRDAGDLRRHCADYDVTTMHYHNKIRPPDPNGVTVLTLERFEVSAGNLVELCTVPWSRSLSSTLGLFAHSSELWNFPW